MSQTNQSFIEYKTSLYQRTKEKALHHLTRCRDLKCMRGMINFNKFKRYVEKLPAEQFSYSWLNNGALTFGLQQENRSWEIWVNTPLNTRDDLWEGTTLNDMITTLDVEQPIFEPLISLLKDIQRVHGDVTCYRAKDSFDRETGYRLVGTDNKDIFFRLY